MIKYIIKRILIFIPTLILISLLTFFISVNTPGDPVEIMMNTKGPGGDSRFYHSENSNYLEQREKLGLDQPLFYFTITNATLPDTLYRIPDPGTRENLERLAWEFGDWENVARFYRSVRALHRSLPEGKERLAGKVEKLLAFHQPSILKDGIRSLEKKLPEHGVSNKMKKVTVALEEMVRERSFWYRYIPNFNWHGIDNQYHEWFFGDRPWFGKEDPAEYYRTYGFLRGDFGVSYADKRPVSTIIWEALKWTFSLSLVAILITYTASVPIGVYSATHKGSKKEHTISTVLFMLFSLPNFWVGTLMITFLCNPDFFNWFPPAFSLMDIPENASIWYEFQEIAHHSLLPIVCYTYGSFAYLSRQMRGGILETLERDFIRTARAKGLPEGKVIWKHSFRNSLIPMITLFGAVFPALISGSLVIETIFSIPGMGKVSYEALIQRNYPVIYSIMMFTAILTLLGTLLADILYAVVDPRVSYSKKTKNG